VIDVRELHAEYEELRKDKRNRDSRMNRVREARMPGGLRRIYPDMFPEDGPYDEAMVANMIDVAAKDIAEVLGVMPTLSCASSGASDRASAFADKRTKISYGYADTSRMNISLIGLADQYVTYSFAVGVTLPDFDRKSPVIQFLNPIGCYPVLDRWGDTKRLYQTMKLSTRKAKTMFPELALRLDKDYARVDNGYVDIVRAFCDDYDYVFTPMYSDLLLLEATNPTGECAAHAFLRPSLDPDEQIGSFDDVLPVQVAKARFALLTLEAATKSVQAPLALPTDVQEVNLGPDSTLRSATPEKIGYVGLNLPPAAFAQQAALDQELRAGARYPETRTGNTDASIITGRGVQALGAGFDSQIKAGQAVLANGISKLMSKAFKLDEALWPNVEKTVRGNTNGTPYELRYTPSKDIKGDHTIDVQYGLMAGLQANQALVFGLQARGDKLISRRFLRTQLPVAFDPAAEESQVDVEDMRDSLKEAFAALAGAIPQSMQTGMAPGQVLAQMALVIKARQKGTPIEEAIADAFEQPEPEGEAVPDAGLAGVGQAPPAGAGPMAAGAAPPGVSGGGEQVRPDLMQMIAGLTGRGASLGASVIRRQPV